MSETAVNSVDASNLNFVLPGRARRLITALVRAVIAILLCLTPVTAVFVLGWLTRVMRREAAIALLRRSCGLRRREAVRRLVGMGNLAPLAVPPGLIADRTQGGVARWLGGLWQNTHEGAVALLASLALTLPFGLLWLGAWWGGWENSFNKGYEQAAVGQIAALMGIVVALIVLRHLPMSLAHQAATRRLSAVFEWRTIRKLTRAAGLWTLWPALLMALGGLLVLGLRVSPLGMEWIVPGFADFDESGVARIAGKLTLVSAAVAFVTSFAVRVAAARLYARAVQRLASGGIPGFDWASPLLAAASSHATPSMPSRMTTLIASLFAYALGFVLIASIFVAQFFNHSWVLWATHPVIGLPWLP